MSEYYYLVKRRMNVHTYNIVSIRSFLCNIHTYQKNVEFLFFLRVNECIRFDCVQFPSETYFLFFFYVKSIGLPFSVLYTKIFSNRKSTSMAIGILNYIPTIWVKLQSDYISLIMQTSLHSYAYPIFLHTHTYIFKSICIIAYTRLCNKIIHFAELNKKKKSNSPT